MPGNSSRLTSFITSPVLLIISATFLSKSVMDSPILETEEMTPSSSPMMFLAVKTAVPSKTLSPAFVILE